MPPDFSPYDRRAWDDVDRWRDKRLTGRSRSLIPSPVRNQLDKGRAAVQERFAAVPGSDQFAELFQRALGGIQDTINRVVVATVRERAVIRAFERRGHEINELREIRALDLEAIDRAKPRLDLRYPLALAAEGAAAGFAVSGGEIVAAGGAIAGAGAGAAPGAGTVVGAMAADAAAVLAASARVVAETAAYYGYDPQLPEERLFALGVLNFGTATQAGKMAAYRELNKIVQSLARRATWEQLNKSAITHIVRGVYASLGIRITKEKLGQALPIVGIVIGAGLNAELLARVASDADHLYRERFLREKYGVPMPVDEESIEIDHSRDIPLAEIIDAELDDVAGDVAQTGDQQPATGTTAEEDVAKG